MSKLQRVEPAGTLEVLALEINAEHRAFVGTFRKTVEHGIRAGELLAKAKAQCPHGTWLPWLEQNFEGASRTAQEYMRLYNHRDEILAKTRSSAHLSVSGALKELAAPSPQKAEPTPDAAERAEQSPDVSLIRDLQGRFLRFWSDEEREAFERILANPGPLEEELIEELGGADLMAVAAQVAVDGFLFEDGPEEGHPLISYRAPLGKPAKDKEEVVRVSIPALEAIEKDTELAECIKRGCWQFGLLELKSWRSLHNWFARALAADPQTNVEVWEKRVAHNADWRQLDPACEFLTERIFHPETGVRQWVREHNLKPGEFRTALELAEWFVGDFAERLWVGLTDKRSERGERLQRWKDFELTAQRGAG